MSEYLSDTPLYKRTATGLVISIFLMDIVGVFLFDELTQAILDRLFLISLTLYFIFINLIEPFYRLSYKRAMISIILLLICYLLFMSRYIELGDYSTDICELCRCTQLCSAN